VLLRALAFLPIAHLALCYMYLYFLALGFGGKVGNLFSASDIFTVGFNKVAPFYVTIFFAFIVTHLWMEERPLAIAGRDDFRLHESLRGRRFALFMNVMVILAPISQILWIIFLKKVILIVILWGFFLPLSYILAKIFEVNDFKPIYRFPIFMAFFGLSQLGISAYNEGFRYRLKEYDYFSDSATICDESNKFLFSASGWMIAVQEDGQRVGYSTDCKNTIRFQNRVIEIDSV